MAITPVRLESATDGDKSITGEGYAVHVLTFQALTTLDPKYQVIRVVGPKRINPAELWGTRQATNENIASFVDSLYELGFVGVDYVQVTTLSF